REHRAGLEVDPEGEGEPQVAGGDVRDAGVDEYLPEGPHRIRLCEQCPHGEGCGGFSHSVGCDPGAARTTRARRERRTSRSVTARPSPTSTSHGSVTPRPTRIAPQNATKAFQPTTTPCQKSPGPSGGGARAVERSSSVTVDIATWSASERCCASNVSSSICRSAIADSSWIRSAVVSASASHEV